MKATKKMVKAIVESEAGTKVAWARRVAIRKFLGEMVSIWSARTMDGREWWVIPYPGAYVYPAGASMDHDGPLKCYLDLLFCLSDAEMTERYRKPRSVGAWPAEAPP
jgi:hypothetical protein